jgi:hypothetical protein
VSHKVNLLLACSSTSLVEGPVCPYLDSGALSAA